MPLVINEFEVIAEPPAAPSPAQSAPGGQTGGESAASASVAAISPHEIERVLRRSAERLARIWAH